jgi:curved DNA-binding protein CbpA
MRTSNSLYSLLQVLPTADPAVIEAAYKALMKKHHPDLHGGADAARRAAEISHAFNVLRDPERRADYDSDEKARQERYKVELARAFPEAGSSGSLTEGRRNPILPNARPESPARAGQRLATFVGGAGVLSLAATIFLLARGGNEPSIQQQPDTGSATVSTMPAEDPSVSPAAAPVPFRDQPVSAPQIANAVAEFGRISSAEGIQAAAQFSQRCFDTQSRTLSVGQFDYCVAFDHAAGRIEVAPSQNAAARRFQPQYQVARHVRAADPLADTFASIEIRLYEIRRLADAALARPIDRPVTAVPITGGGVAVTVPTPRRDTVRRQSPERRANQANRSRPRQERDFLEREGGIY